MPAHPAVSSPVDHDEAAQSRYRCRLGWGRYGAARAAARGDIAVIVDTLRFSTAVAAAARRGVSISPCAAEGDIDRAAAGLGLPRSAIDPPVPARPDRLSPRTYERVPPSTRLAVLSPNGAACALEGRDAPRVFVGALVNAEAVAVAVQSASHESGRPITVVACGERWQVRHQDGALRMAVEDYLGAGAILSYLAGTKAPEATVCQAAFRSSRDRLDELLWDSASGWELRQKGLGGDVRLASQLNHWAVAPVLRGDWLEGSSSPGTPTSAPGGRRE